ncbi:hypothetical protein Ancab_039245 [Ancistrocladus abbreviatus]
MGVHEVAVLEQLGPFKLGLDLSAKLITPEIMGSPNSQQSFGPCGLVTRVHDKATEDTRRNTKRSPSTLAPIEVYEHTLPAVKPIHNGTIVAAIRDRDMNNALDRMMNPVKMHKRLKKMEEILNLRLPRRGNGGIRKKTGRKLHGEKAKKAMAPSQESISDS